MQIELRFFAALREALGTSAMSWDTQATTVSGLRDELIARGQPWADALARGRAVRVSCNQLMVDEGAGIQAGDEVAFFPPVTGG